MSETRTITAGRILAFSALVEMATGIGLIVAPAMVIAWLVPGEMTDLVLVLARALGITLLGLGLSCWPKWHKPHGTLAALRGMLTYNGLIALLLGYAGSVLRLAGPLLWPTVVLHGAVALLLVWRRKDTESDV